MTDKLFYKDLYLKNFDATVTKSEKVNGNFSIVLDQTAFYPTGGGQPCDKGTINSVPVLNVYEKNGEIWHEVAEEIKEQMVHGQIDWQYRFDLMQQHLGQHILSAVFVRDHSADTINLRMDNNGAYIDLNKFIPENDISLAESMANEIIYADMPVEILYPTIEEIQSHSKRKIPVTDEAIRIVKIGDLDYTPCCGTQNSRTGEVGLIKIAKTEKHKTGSRIYFTCGRKGFAYICDIHQKISSLQKILDCPQEEIVDRVLKTKEENHSTKEALLSLRKEKIHSLAKQLIDTANVINDIKVVAYIFENGTPEDVKLLFEQLTSENIVAFLGSKTESGSFIMYGCNKKMKNIDIREIFKKNIRELDGRGGGSPFMCQGTGKSAQNLDKIIGDAAHTFLISK